MAYQASQEGEDSYSNANGGVSGFQNFFQGWLIRQNEYLDELLSAQMVMNSKTGEEDQLRSLVSRVLKHYQQYYEAKSMVSRRDVFVLFAPPWFSSLERTFLWIAGFKPGLLIRILGKSVRDLTEEQKRMMVRLTAETRSAEKELSDELALIQESVASAVMVDLGRRAGRLVDGEATEVDTAFQRLREAMEGLVVGADYLRATTTGKIVDMLNPVQGIRFLTAATQLQVRIRTLGSSSSTTSYSSSTTHQTATPREGAGETRNI